MTEKKHQQIKEHQLPETGFVRIPTILKYFPVGRSTWWAGVKSGKYPVAIKLSPNITVWRAADIHKLIAEMEGTHDYFN